MLDIVQHWVLSAGAWGALGFFVGAVLEEVAFPFPSPLLLVGAAFFFGKPISVAVIVKIFATVILPIVTGATVGSLVIYGLAYYGGKPAIDRWGKYFKVTWDSVLAFQRKLGERRSDEWILFLSRALPFAPTSVLTVIAGTMRMNVVVYAAITFLGIFVRVTCLFAGALIFGKSIFH